MKNRKKSKSKKSKSVIDWRTETEIQDAVRKWANHAMTAIDGLEQRVAFLEKKIAALHRAMTAYPAPTIQGEHLKGTPGTIRYDYSR